MSNSKEDTYDACEEFVKIIKENYTYSPQFRDELSAALKRKSGNDNLGRLCDNIINELQLKGKIVT